MIEAHDRLPLLPDDARTLASVSGSVWDGLRDSHILITGGTGFVGTWLVVALAWANRELQLGATATIVSRDPDAFVAREPWVKRQQWIGLSRGDAREMQVPAGDHTHAIVGAASTDARITRDRPLSVMEAAISGTARVLRGVGPGCSTLVLSSGAVYGDDSLRPDSIPEDYQGALDWLDPANAYHQAKRATEAMVIASGQEAGRSAAIARLFAFHGPWLPTDRHFAIGNFLRDALDDRDIVIRGDGSPVRSYLYAADMAAWLLTILVQGERGRTYNVGSDQAVTIAELAHLVAEAVPDSPRVRVLGETASGGGGQRYVPDVTRARDELGLQETVSLKDGLARTVGWLRTRREDAWA